MTDAGPAAHSGPAWRAPFTNSELNALHADGFGHPVTDVDWWTRVRRHSLGWVCARDGGALVGFVNVAWDGGAHAFLLDTVVAGTRLRRGIGTALVAAAADGARAAGCAWLHVDYEPHLRGFYETACGLTPSPAALLPLD